MKSHKLFLISLALLFLATTAIACKGKDNKSNNPTTVNSSANITARSGDVVANSSLLGSLPDSTGALIYWNTLTKGFKKLNNSAWKPVSYLDITPGKNSTIGGVELISFFQSHGINLNQRDKDDSQKLFSEAALFSTPWTDKIAPLAFLFRSRPEIDTAKIFNSLKEELKKKGTKIEDLKIEGVSGFRAEVEIPKDFLTSSNNIAEKLRQTGKQVETSKEVKTSLLESGLYFAWANKKVVLSNTDEHIKAGLLTNKSKLPSLLTDAAHKEATKGFNPADSQLLFALADLNRLHAKALPNTSFRRTSLELAMLEAPVTDFRVFYDAAQAPDTSLFKTLANSSSSETSNLVSEKPMLFLSLDGQTISRIKSLIAGTKKNTIALSILDGIKRLGVAAKVAPTGQSMFPIPALAILFETDSKETAQAKLNTLASLTEGLSALSGGMLNPPSKDPNSSEGGLQTKTILETEVKYMLSPIGVGVFLAQKGNSVVATLDEREMTKVLSANGKSFASGLAKNSNKLISKNDSVLNFYFDFEQFGGLLESMGGLLAMYAPNDKDAQKLVEKENIESMKKMGKTLGSLTHEPGLVRFYSYYE